MASEVPPQRLDDDEEKPKRRRACQSLREEAKRCIKESACVQIDKRAAKECVTAYDGRVPDKCYSLLTALSDCKRSMVDARSRFRGRKEGGA